ncbi:RebB family R body protein [Chryseobacterium sp. ISL-6]|uniref:RebB family R body protein n=1 Tax=Chryseobacterium sp. ISL-6 TaxID=2819143 RepID=UPI002035D338|nr:RebB family R body protein [Chryseobacterium sp. ISL-6]
MNHAHEPQPAKMTNLRSLQELSKAFSFQKEQDPAYFSKINPDHNSNRFVFNVQTTEIEAMPTIRLVHCINSNSTSDAYQSFVVEPKDQSTGISVVMMKWDDSKNLHCHIDILPFNSLGDIAEPENDSKILGINIEKSKVVLKMDIEISQSDTDEAMYTVHDVNVNSLEDFVTADEIIELKRMLEFQAAKLIAHYILEVYHIVHNGYQNNTVSLVSENDLPQIPTDQTNELLSANIAAGSIALGSVYQSLAHSTVILFENAVNNQNQQNSLTQAAANQGVMQIYYIDTMADAVGIAMMLGMG